MTSDELRTRYTKAVRVINAERKMRQRVFREDAVKLAAKVGEMDEVLATLLWMKDELKERLGNDTVQPALLDVPRKAEYN